MNSTGWARRPPPYSVLHPRQVSMRLGPRSPQHWHSRRTTPSSTIVTSGRDRPPATSSRTSRSVRRTSAARNVNPWGVPSTVLRRSSFRSAERLRLRTEWTAGSASPRTPASHPIPRLMGNEQSRAASIVRCQRLPVPGVLRIWRQLSIPGLLPAPRERFALASAGSVRSDGLAQSFQQHFKKIRPSARETQPVGRIIPHKVTPAASTLIHTLLSTTFASREHALWTITDNRSSKNAFIYSTISAVSLRAAAWGSCRHVLWARLEISRDRAEKPAADCAVPHFRKTLHGRVY